MGMHLIGTSKTEVSVRNETQNQSTGAGRESSRASGGLSTWGEFGSTLLIILSDSEHGKTEWSHWEQTSSGRMAVFHYEVPRNASHYEIVTPVEELQSSGQSTRWAGSRAADMGPVSVSTRFVRKKPAYQGSLWIDADTGTITRVTLVADLRGNPTFERGAILVDYGPVQIADKTLICPVRSLALSSAPSTVNTTFSGVATEWLNENLFTDYHLFGSTARILGNQVAETAPPQPSPESAPGAASAAIAEPATESQASPSLLTPTQAAPLPASSPQVAMPPPPAEHAETSAPGAPTIAGAAISEPNPSANAPGPSSSVSDPVPPPLSPAAHPSESGVTFHVNVNSLLVPVVVRDKQGQAVGDLSQADFTVLDNGKPRTIAAVTVVRSAPRASETLPQGSGRLNQVKAPDAPSNAQNRFIIFLFDDRHIDSSDLARTQQAAVRALDNSLAPTDFAAVMSLMGANSGLTQDRAALDAAITKLTVHHSFQHDTHDCPDIDYYSANKILNMHDDTEFQVAIAKVEACYSMPVQQPVATYGTSAIENTNTGVQRLAYMAATRALATGEEDARESLKAVESVVRAMSTLPGQRTLILVSPGFLSMSPETMAFKSQLLDLALASSVIIDTLDARGLYVGNVDASQGGNTAFSQLTGQTSQNRLNSMQESENALAEMANGTGGTFVHNNNDLEAGLKSLIAAPQFLYVLEISLNGIKATGSYHRLQVKLNRAGLQVQARLGYFAPKDPRSKP